MFYLHQWLELYVLSGYDNYDMATMPDEFTGEIVSLPKNSITLTFTEQNRRIIEEDYLQKIEDVLYELYGITVLKEHGFGVTVYYPGEGLHSHYDSRDKSFGTPSGNPTRDYSTIFYLNSDFEGGILHFTKLNIKIKPEPNTMILFPSGELYSHRVEKVTFGVRYMSSNFWSLKETK